jgi:hypothetical protein
VVGWAQSVVIGKRPTGFEGWVQATVIGALVVWFLGMLPSTVMNLLPHDPAEPSPTVQQGTRMLLAAGLGVAAGPVLAVFQFRILRRDVGHAGWWLTANALAWAVGMPVIFAGIHVAYSAVGHYAVVGAPIGTLALAGAAVGAIHSWRLSYLSAAAREPVA